MEYSEMFLLGWACVATVLAVVYREIGRRSHIRMLSTSVLLAEVVTGEVKATNKNGVWTVENDDTKLSFRKAGK